MLLSKGSDESIKDYFNRICENMAILNLTWEDIKELMNKETGNSFGESTYRKKWKSYKEGLKDGFRKAIDQDATLKEHELSLQKIQEEKVKLRDNRNALATQIRAKARFDNIIEDLKKEMGKPLTPFKAVEKIDKGGDDDIIVAAFSDFHVGNTFENHFGSYSIDIFKRRLEEYVGRLISIGKKNGIKTIKILALGDEISGSIHTNTRLQNAEDVISQVKIVSEYIAQALHQLSEHFTVVEYYTAIGNHGRVSPNKEESLYNENFELLIPWYIEAKLSNVPNVKIMKNEVDAGIITANVFTEVVFGVHGDRDSLARAGSVLPAMLRKFPLSIWAGHLHSFGAETFHGIELIKSGSLCGTDEYAKNMRLTGKPCQTVAIYNKEEGLVELFNINFK